MRNTAKMMMKAGAAVLLLSGLAIAPLSHAASKVPSPAACKQSPGKGGCIVINKKKGNCMACHVLSGGNEVGLQMGNIAPPLISMKQRKDSNGKPWTKDSLRARLWDPTKENPHSTMPPFGRHGILSEEEIDKVVEFILSI